LLPLPKIKIIPIRAGVGCCYLIIKNSECFLVDTGVGGHEQKIISAIESRGLKLASLKFIFLTHTHYDHAGNVNVIKKVSGAKVIVHSSESQNLIEGYHQIPNGTTLLFKIISNLGKLFQKSRTRFRAVNPDITFDKTFDLQQFGFEGLIIHTPGHTIGSSSLIMGDHMFAGDSVFNFMNRIFPPFANDKNKLKESWKILLDYKAKYYYPAHGARLTFEQLSKTSL
jgi:glyoxylase-like metal-dependent hydrolase (beta-lactamase superfamily II)